MASIDLYHDLDLDRSKSPAELAAELDHRLRGVSWDDKSTHEQLTVARKILGDATKRTMYDQRLADPSASIDVDNLRGLAYQDVKQPPAALSAASTVAVDKVKSFYRTDTKPKLAGTAVAAIAVLGLVGAGVASCGNDDDGNAGTSTATSSDGRGTNGGSASSGSSDDGLSDYEFVSPGEEVVVTSGDPYEYDDGHTEYVDGGEFGFTVDNMRMVDMMTRPDPKAPDDHPDAKSQKYGEAVCFDLTTRMISADESVSEMARSGDSRTDEFEMQVKQAVKPSYTTVNPILDEGGLGKDLNSAVTVSTPPGADDPLRINDEGEVESTASGEAAVVNTEDGTVDYGYCLPVAGTNASAGTSGDEDEPDRNVGYVVSAEVNASNGGANPEVRGWRFDH